MKRLSVWIAFSIGALALASPLLLQSSVLVNGKAGKTPPLEKEGEIYIPLSTLKEAGAEIQKVGGKVTVRFTPIAGAVQLDANEGVVGEWLSNGVWRMRLSNPKLEDGVYSIDWEVRNMTSQTLRPTETGMKWPDLFAADSGKLDSLPRSDRAANELSFSELAPGAMVSRRLEWYVKSGQKPDKFVVRFEVTDIIKQLMAKSKVAFAGPSNFRVFLNK